MKEKIKQFLKRRYLDQTYSCLTIAVFVLMIFCYLIVCLSKVYFSQIDAFIKKYTPWTSVLGIVVTIISPCFQYLVKFFKNRFKEQSNTIEVKPTRISSGIVSTEDLQKTYKISDIVSEKRFEVNDNVYNLDNVTCQLVKDKCAQKNTTCVTCLSLMLEQKILFRRAEQIRTKLEKHRKQEIPAIILTGKSGSGKTLLLRILQLQATEFDFMFFSDTYIADQKVGNFIDCLSDACGKNQKTIIVFDQFEKSISNSDLFYGSIFDQLSRIDNIVVVFVIREEYIATLLNRWSYLADSIFFLSFESNDLEDMKKNCINYLSVNEEELDSIIKNPQDANSDVKRILGTVINDVKNKKRPLVFYELIFEILEQKQQEDNFSEFLNRLVENPDLLIDCYFDEWLSNFSNWETGLAILYLLSNYQKYSVKDIEYVTFFKSQAFVPLLESNNFIRCSKGEAQQLECEFIHDYIADSARRYCKEHNSFSETMAENIEFYRNNIKPRDENLPEKKEISRSFTTFHSKSSQNFLQVYLLLLLCGTIVFGFLKLAERAPIQCIEMSFILLNCMFSTYYMYYFCFEFLKILQIRYLVPLVLVCTLAIWGAILLLDYWAVFLGAGAIILAFYMLFMSKNKQIKSKKIFSNNFKVFGSIGFMTVSLGLMFAFLTNGIAINIDHTAFKISFDNFTLIPRVCLEGSYHILYLVFILMSSFNHINTTYLFERIGLSNRIEIKKP